jgi:hypothetical protein
MRLSDRCFSVSCIQLKMPLLPGIAIAIDRSSPSNCCHLRTLVRRCVCGRAASRVCHRSRRCASSSIVMAMVSRIQPRTIFRVSQCPSPCRSFFSEAGSLRWGLSVGDRGRNTLSRECSMMRLTTSRRGRDPWQLPMKSSTKTSTLANGREW